MCPQNFLKLGWSNPPGGGGVSSDPGEKNALFEIPGEKISTWGQNPKPVVLLGSTVFRCRKPTKNPKFSRRLRRAANNIQFLGSLDQIWGSGPEHQLVTHARHFVFAPFQHGGSDFGSLNPQSQVSQHTLPHKVPGFREIERGPYRFDYRTPRHGGSRSFDFADVRRLFGNKNPEIGITSLMLESVLGTKNINLIPNQ